jgi:hypothetical protein
MVPPPTVLVRVPRLTLALGAVIDRTPPVTASVTGVAAVVAAEAGRAMPSVSSPVVAAPSKPRVLLILMVFLPPQ